MPKREVNLPLNLILLGDPAAGKATQAALLAKKFKLYDFDMGKELSRRRQNDKKLHSALTVKTDQGQLTPTVFVREIFREVISKAPTRKGILFDGTPKMLGEAKLVSKLLKQQNRPDPLVIYISIPVDETVRRINQRSGYFKGKFGKRADDSIEALKNRARYYRKNVSEVVKFFEKKYHFEKVSGMGTQAQVHRRIMVEVKKFLNKK